MKYHIKRIVNNRAKIVQTISPAGCQQREAMGVDLVDMTFELAAAFDFQLGDFVDVYRLRYKLNRLPQVQKISSCRFAYAAQFEAEWYDLAKVQYQFLNPDNKLLEPVFDLTGNGMSFVDLLVQNANRHSPGWTIGMVDDTPYITLSFNAQNCLQVLHQLSGQFNTEFWIDNKTIHLQKREQSSGYVFKYGKGNGLYNINRQNKNAADIITRLYVRGGSKNLPADYRSTSLLLPNKQTFIQQDEKVKEFGLIESTIIFNEIIPERTGVVTQIQQGEDNWRFFYDSALDFDINNHAAPGLDAKVHFNSGQLAGYSFTFTYNHYQRKFTLNKNADETHLNIPSSTLRPAVGDKYVLIDIQMPQSYLTAAEDRLKNAAQAYYNSNSDLRFLLTYTASCDPLFVSKNNIEAVLGNTAILQDDQLGINTELRIAKYARDLQNPHLYNNLEWGEVIGVNQTVRQYQQQQKTLRMIESSGLLDPAQMRKALFLNRLSEKEGYLMLGANKIKAGIADLATNALRADLSDYALDADKWDGRQFSDYLNQSLRATDDVRFKSVASTAYLSGALGEGFKIDNKGNAEFDNLTVRKQFNAFQFIINKIRASNGAVAITDAATVASVETKGSRYEITTEEDLPFQTDDILRCQVFSPNAIKAYWLQIAPQENLKAKTFSALIIAGNGQSIAPGDTLVRMGNVNNLNRQGLLYLTASDNNAPYLDVLDGVTNHNLTGKTKVRIGKLEGITDADFGNLSGYGLYGQNVYLCKGKFKGEFIVTGGNAETLTGALAKANAAQAAAEGKINALAASLKAMAYQQVVELSKLGDTIIEGGKIKTMLLDVNYIKAHVINGQYVNTLSLDASVIKSGIIDSERINAAQIVSKGGGVNQLSVDAAKAQAISIAADYTQAKAEESRQYSEKLAEELKAGGQNLARDGSFSKGFGNWQVDGMVTFENIDGKTALHFIKDKTDSGIYSSGVLTRQIKPNTQYAVSFEIKWANYKGGNLLIRLNGIDKEITAPKTTSWQRVSGAVKTGNNPVSNVIMIYGGAGDQDFYITNLKIEEGYKSTVFTLAPEDVQEAIDEANRTAKTAAANYASLTASLKSLAYQDVVELSKLGNTIIEGGKIKTALLDANYIKSNIVNAAYIQALDIVATKVAATQGHVGGFNIVNKSLIAGSNSDNPGSWDLNSSYVMLYTDYQLFRKVGNTTDQTDEMSINLGYYSAATGFSYKDTAVIKNNILNTRQTYMPASNLNGSGAVYRKKNRALILEANNSDENIALEVMSGHIYLRGVNDAGSENQPRSGYIKYVNMNGRQVLVLDNNPPEVNVTLYGNTEQTATVRYGPCSNGEVGTSHSYTVPANTYMGITQAEANTAAYQAALQQAQSNANKYGYCQKPEYRIVITKSRYSVDYTIYDLTGKKGPLPTDVTLDFYVYTRKGNYNLSVTIFADTISEKIYSDGYYINDFRVNTWSPKQYNGSPITIESK